MDIKNFVATAALLPVTKSILIRGPHGIGKSDLMRFLQRVWKLKNRIDRRVSQMSEGDMIGLPELRNGVTYFCHPDWFSMACEEPTLLILDEYNRGLPEVMQGGFQIVLDRELNGKKLHKESRVICAINDGGEYQVTDMDPALLDRFWVVDLNPTVEDWLDFAKLNDPGAEPPKVPYHDVVIDFIKMHHSCLDPNMQKAGTEKQPSRRSWSAFHDNARALGMLDHEYTRPVPGDKDEKSQLLFNLAGGYLGTDVAQQFVSYIRNLDRQVTALDVLDRYDTVKAKIDQMGQDKWNVLSDRIVELGHKQVMTLEQVKNLGKFFASLPSGELAVHFWTSMAKDPNAHSQANIKIMHPYVVNNILKVFGKKAAVEVAAE